MLDLIKEFLQQNYIIYFLYALLLIITIYCVYCILNYFKFHSHVQTNIKQLYNKMSEDDKIRADRERQERDLHGLTEKKDFLDKVNEELVYSGIKDKYNWITTELYILMVIIAMTLAFLLGTLIGNILYGLGGLVLVFLINKLTLMVFGNHRNNRIEEAMLQLMNIIDNFSKSSDDLITILERSSRYVDDPLGSIIYNATIKARSSGDASLAMDDLRDSVKNRYFKVMIKSLEISSRHGAEYSSIVQDCRESYHMYLKNEKEKHSMKQNGVVEIIAMLLIGILCLYWLGIMTNYPNVFLALYETGTLGRIILGVIIFAVVLSLYMIIEVMKDKT